MNRVLMTRVLPLVIGALLTGILLSVYAATNYVIPLNNGKVVEETLGWTLDLDLFMRFLRYALPGSLLFFLVAGPSVCWLLNRLGCLNYLTVLLSGAISGFTITFVFNKEISILYHGMIAIIFVAGITVSWILHRHFVNIPE